MEISRVDTINMNGSINTDQLRGQKSEIGVAIRSDDEIAKNQEALIKQMSGGRDLDLSKINEQSTKYNEAPNELSPKKAIVVKKHGFTKTYTFSHLDIMIKAPNNIRVCDDEVVREINNDETYIAYVEENKLVTIRDEEQAS